MQKQQETCQRCTEVQKRAPSRMCTLCEEKSEDEVYQQRKHRGQFKLADVRRLTRDAYRGDVRALAMIRGLK